MDAPGPTVTLGSNLLRPRRKGARRWLVVASLVAHVGVIGAYVVTGMMRIERLPMEKGRISVAVTPRIDTEAGGGMRRGKKPPPPPSATPTRRKPPTMVQPVDQSHVSSDATAAADPDTLGLGDDGDDDDIVGDPTLPPGGGGCTGVDCATAKPADKRPADPAPETVAPTVIGSLRLSGETQIHPPALTLDEMIHSGKTKVLGIIKLCLDASGRVSSAQTIKSTGFPAYDTELVRGVRAWTYRPHTVNGRPVPVCSTVSFAYSVKDR